MTNSVAFSEMCTTVRRQVLRGQVLRDSRPMYARWRMLDPWQRLYIQQLIHHPMI